MAGLDLAAIRAELVRLIQGVDRQKLNVYSAIPDRPVQLPAVVLVPGDPWVDPHSAFSKGLATVSFEAQVFTARTDSGLLMLDEFASAGTGHGNSIVDAIEAGKSTGTTDGIWSDVKVSGVRWGGAVVLEQEAQVQAWQAFVDLLVFRARS